MRPEKKERNCTRFVVGGDCTNYPGEVATPTADMLVAKILFNSVVSMPGAKFMTINISNFYLMTPLKRAKYIYIHIKDIPEKSSNSIFSRTRPRQMVQCTLRQIGGCMDSLSQGY